MGLLLAVAIAPTALAPATLDADQPCIHRLPSGALVRYRRNSAGARIVQHVPDRFFTFFVEGVALAMRG